MNPLVSAKAFVEKTESEAATHEMGIATPALPHSSVCGSHTEPGHTQEPMTRDQFVETIHAGIQDYNQGVRISDRQSVRAVLRGEIEAGACLQAG